MSNYYSINYELRITNYELFLPYALLIMTIYRPGEFAALIGVSVNTLQRWDRDKILVANRNVNGRRYYTQEQYVDYLAKHILDSQDCLEEISLRFSHKENKLITPEQIDALIKICEVIHLQLII